MKKLFSLLLIASLFSLTGCLEIVRNITINDNGSGAFETKIDMGEVFEMVRSMGQEQQLAEAKSKEVDTLIQIKDIVDQAGDLTAAEKQLLSNGHIRINLNVDSSIFYTKSLINFKAVTDIEQINLLSQRFLSNAMDKVLEEGEAAAEEPAKNESMLGATFDDYYKYTYTKNSIEKKLNTEKTLPTGDDEATKAFQEMSAMGMDIKSTIVYNLPRAAKSIEGKNAVLSADKKKVTITSGLNDFTTDATSLEFKITF